MRALIDIEAKTITIEDQQVTVKEILKLIDSISMSEDYTLIMQSLAQGFTIPDIPLQDFTITTPQPIWIDATQWQTDPYIIQYSAISNTEYFINTSSTEDNSKS